ATRRGHSSAARHISWTLSCRDATPRSAKESLQLTLADDAPPGSPWFPRRGNRYWERCRARPVCLSSGTALNSSRSPPPRCATTGSNSSRTAGGLMEHLDGALDVRPPGGLGRFGEYGGRFVPESLVPACDEVEREFRTAWVDPSFRRRFERVLSVYAGRPTALTPAWRLSAELGITLL